MILAVAAIVALTVIEVVALLNGIDGQLMTLIIIAISVLAGAKIRDILPK